MFGWRQFYGGQQILRSFCIETDKERIAFQILFAYFSKALQGDILCLVHEHDNTFIALMAYKPKCGQIKLQYKNIETTCLYAILKSNDTCNTQCSVLKNEKKPLKWFFFFRESTLS